MCLDPWPTLAFMRYAPHRHASDRSTSDEEALAFEQATTIANDLAAELTAKWSSEPLSPDVRVELTTGEYGDPLFVFSVNVDLPDDLPAAEYPMDHLSGLKKYVRARIIATPVDEWKWLVEVGTKARFTYP